MFRSLKRNKMYQFLQFFYLSNTKNINIFKVAGTEASTFKLHKIIIYFRFQNLGL